MKKLVHISIYALLGVILLAVGELVLSQWSVGGICPEILTIPACYIILISVLLAIVAHAGLIKPSLFYVGAGIPWIIAVIGTTLQLAGSVQCPQTEGGIPKCFISLGIFTTIIILKFVKPKL